ncbi:MAG: hypothetical protein EPO24_07820 [Bacteroidetes bacterium]|nr:MAG: hypothetical protein EPO24_07820 [Bacteroidota bacterium]
MPAIQNVPNTDTPNEGRVKWNANDIELETRIATHKESNDHDPQYYTKIQIGEFLDAQQATINTLEADLTDLNEAAVKLTGAQDVSGVKTFTDIPEIKPGTTTAELKLRSIAGAVEGQSKIGDWNYETYHALMLLINTATVANPNWQQLLFAKSNDLIARFISDVYAAGKKLATEEYVGKLVKSGRFVMETSMKYTVAGTATVNFINHGAGIKRFIVPESCRLTKVTYASWDSVNERGYSETFEADHYFNFNEDNKRLIRPELVFTTGESITDVTLKLYAEDTPVGAQTSEEVFSQAMFGVIDGANEFYLTLEFSV